MYAGEPNGTGNLAVVIGTLVFVVTPSLVAADEHGLIL